MQDNSNRVVCIFAHPDDEAFGPSGTIAKFTERGEVYIICVANGNDRTNGIKNLHKIRRSELQNSAKIIGVKKVYFLGYRDGKLSNNLYHKVAGKMKKILQRIRPDTLLTFEMRGVSGHIDHVFCSMVTSYLFREMPYVNKLMYYVTRRQVSDKMTDYFIYFPPGYKESEVDLAVDVSKYWDLKVKAIKAHASQAKDGERVLRNLAKLPKKELFFVLKKEKKKSVRT